MKKLYRNMRLFTAVDNGRALAGAEQGKISELKNASMLVSNGVVERVGAEDEVTKGICGRDISLEKDFG